MGKARGPKRKEGAVRKRGHGGNTHSNSALLHKQGRGNNKNGGASRNEGLEGELLW